MKWSFAVLFGHWFVAKPQTDKLVHISLQAIKNLNFCFLFPAAFAGRRKQELQGLNSVPAKE